MLDAIWSLQGQRRHREPNAHAQTKALRALLVAEGGANRTSDEAKKAIAFCHMRILDYEWWLAYNTKQWVRWQRIAITAGVLATLAGVITIPVPDDWGYWTKFLRSCFWVRSIPAAIATIAASFFGAFNYRDQTVRHAITASTLWNELARFQTRSAPYDKTDEKDTSAFLNTVCGLINAESQGWRKQIKDSQSDVRGGDTHTH